MGIGDCGHGEQARLDRAAEAGRRRAGRGEVAAEEAEIAPGARVKVRTGLAIALPDGFVGLVHPRSGLAARLGVTVLNAPGTVDAGYRGEILVNLINHDRENTVKISRGDRIAQLVIQRVERAVFHAVDTLGDTVRGPIPPTLLVGGFMVPFFFLFNPGLNAQGTLGKIVADCFFATGCTVFASFALHGMLGLRDLPWWQRVLLAGCSVTTIVPNREAQFGAMVLGVAILGFAYLRRGPAQVDVPAR